MRFLSAALFASLAFPPFLPAQDLSAFAGSWRQDIPDSSPRSKTRKPKELNVAITGDNLTMAITGPGKVHHIEVTFQIGGPEVTYTGLDGDEFHIKLTREGNSLIFAGREHEDGHNYAVHEVWTLRDKSEGQVLVDTKDAKDPDEPRKSVTEYERIKQ